MTVLDNVLIKISTAIYADKGWIASTRSDVTRGQQAARGVRLALRNPSLSEKGRGERGNLGQVNYWTNNLVANFHDRVN